MAKEAFRGPGRYSMELRKTMKRSGRSSSPTPPQSDINPESFFGPWRPIGRGEKINPDHVHHVDQIPHVPSRLYGPKPQ